MELVKHEINLLLIEDNETFCHLILRELKKPIQNMNILSRFSIQIFPFNNSVECILTVKKFQFRDTIAIIDYYLDEAINGAQIFNLLKDNNKSLAVILISKSALIKEKVSIFVKQNIHFHFVVKDQFTPAICAMFLEHYLKDLY